MDRIGAGDALRCPSVLTLVDSQHGLRLRKHHIIAIGAGAVILGVIMVGREFGIGVLVSSGIERLLDVLAGKGLAEV